MNLMPPPWSDPRMVNAAIDLACDVRNLAPADIRREISKISPETLADLAIVVAAMVDIDQPMEALRKWDDAAFVGEREDHMVDRMCKNGHILKGGNLVRGGRRPSGAQRIVCSTCERERAERYRARRKAAP